MENLTKLKGSLLFLGIGVILFVSCEKNDKNTSDPIGNKPPIELDCDYFNQDRILVNDPEAPVDYLITCKMAVEADIKVEPGVVIEFEQDAGISIHGAKSSFVAVGTADKPVVLRGVKKEKGYWRGLFFDSNSPINELNHVRIEDAGGMQFNSNGDMGGVIVYADAHFKMKNSTVSNSKTNGFNAVYTESNITAFENNTFTNNKNPVLIAATYLDILNPTNKFLGNEDDFILLYTSGSSGDITTPSTWHKADVPYRSKGGIAFGALVTIQPGVTAEFGPEFLIKVSESGGGIKAIGTTANPIVFTGISKVSKAWKGIYVNSKHPENEIAFTEIHHSGIDAPRANVYLWYESILNIHNVKFKNINGCGINHRLESGGVMNPNLTIGSNITVEPTGCIDEAY